MFCSGVWSLPKGRRKGYFPLAGRCAVPLARIERSLLVETHETGMPISYEKSGPRGENSALDVAAEATRGLKETIGEVATRELSKESFSSVARAGPCSMAPICTMTTPSNAKLSKPSSNRRMVT